MNQEQPTAVNSKMREVQFQIEAPAGRSVFLAGTFNNWDTTTIKLEPNGDGLYSGSILLAPGRYEYKFMVDDTWHIDGQCQLWVSNAYGSLNSIVEVI